MARYICGNPERRAAVAKSRASTASTSSRCWTARSPAHPEWDPLRQLFLVLRLLKQSPPDWRGRTCASTAACG